jgi:hypothetical protein
LLSSSVTYCVNVSARESQRRALAEFISVADADNELRLPEWYPAFWR